MEPTTSQHRAWSPPTTSRAFGPRRAVWIEIDEADPRIASRESLELLTRFDLFYRSLVAVQFNFSQSGHPGGSISAGHIMTGALLDSMDYDIGDPNRNDQDLLSFAAGHKATGLYAMWALRDEVARLAAPDLLPGEERLRLRWEDLLGFRKNPTQATPLFRHFHSKPLDGHPTPMTPFVRIATGPSGVGVGASIGLGFAAADYFGDDAPRIHILEGEGGLTPGRVYEAVASAGTSGLGNVICHVDWNQASIDSDRVTREGDHPGDYVQWDPMEFFYLHDWNVVHVADGFHMGQVLTGQARALALDNGQPTAVVYRTQKGWRYGITGKQSHGGGHKRGSEEYVAALRPLLGSEADDLPQVEDAGDEATVEACHWATLEVLRSCLEQERDVCVEAASRLRAARDRLDARGRRPRRGAPHIERIYAVAEPEITPEPLRLQVGAKTPLRKQLGEVLGYLNEASGGAILIGAADLLDSTAISEGGSAFPAGYFHRHDNPGSRTLSLGGITEDGLSCILTGISGFGRHCGAGASYGAFIGPLGHIPARVHAISQQMHQEISRSRYAPFVLVCGHAGMKTGEDGPTHADPQALQLHLENHVPGTAVTLTPWEPQEIWPLVAAAFRAEPAVIVPFVTRPSERVLDRAALGLAPPAAAAVGVYRLRAAAPDSPRDGTVVLQGSEVTYVFVQEALPRLLADGINLEVVYVASPELFDRLPAATRAAVFGEELALEAMGITGFTLPTMYRWIRSDVGRAHTMHPFMRGRYLGSGSGDMVMREAGLDGDGQYARIREYVDVLRA
jgi:transketolase